MKRAYIWECENSDKIKATDVIPWRRDEVARGTMTFPLKGDFIAASIKIDDDSRERNLRIVVQGLSNRRTDWFPRFSVWLCMEREMAKSAHWIPPPGTPVYIDDIKPNDTSDDLNPVEWTEVCIRKGRHMLFAWMGMYGCEYDFPEHSVWIWMERQL